MRRRPGGNSEYCRLYDRTAKGRERVRRYQQSEKGKAAKRRSSKNCNQRRIWVGSKYCGVATTPEQALAIRAYARRRRREFITRQSAGT